MSPEDYIDMLFCLPQAVGRGIAAQLYTAVERSAVTRGLTRLTAHASLLAQPFFAKHGWEMETQETVALSGVHLPHAAMFKLLARTVRR